MSNHKNYSIWVNVWVIEYVEEVCVYIYIYREREKEREYKINKKIDITSKEHFTNSNG